MKTIFKKMNLPRILIGLVLAIAFILGLPFGNDNLLALAGQKKDSSQDNNLGSQVTQAKESIEANRQNRQSYSDGDSLSQQQTDNSKSFVEKLNLNEPIPQSTKKFFKQVQGQEPIENTTPPYPEKSKPAQ